MRTAQPVTLPAFQATVAVTPDHVRALEAALVSARAAEERFRGLVESIQAIPYIADWDALGTIRYISPQVEVMLGYPAAEWYGGPDPWEANLHAEIASACSPSPPARTPSSATSSASTGCTLPTGAWSGSPSARRSSATSAATRSSATA